MSSDPLIRIAGVDEVGRGPLAGPVVAAAVILDAENPIEGLADSKALTEKARLRLDQQIKDSALAWAIARAEVEEIDQINILQASLLAMRRAVMALKPQADHALVDGNRCPELPCSCEAIIKGDQSVEAISAASIIAKVSRDKEMIEMDALYPGYGFLNHKGYPTKVHMESLRQLGPSPIHRKSFGPVKKALADAGKAL